MNCLILVLFPSIALIAWLGKGYLPGYLQTDKIISWNLLYPLVLISIGGSKEEGQGGHGPPKGLTKNGKMAQFVAFCINEKKIPREHAPRPPKFANLLHIFGARRRWPPPMRTSGAACAHISCKAIGDTSLGATIRYPILGRILK